VRQYEPGFSNKDYGHATLSGLLESQPALFRLRKGDTGQAQVQLIERPVEAAAEAPSGNAHGAPAKPRRSRQPRKQAVADAAGYRTGGRGCDGTGHRPARRKHVRH
jgi:hypothetical protein